jgi:hypothetical protein
MACIAGRSRAERVSGRDAKADRDFSCHRVFGLPHCDVIAATRERQVPWDHSSLTGEVVLAR